MKKFIAAFLICMLMVPSGIALADYEPAANTPYGIPVFNSADEIDAEALTEIINGHGLKRLLDLFDGIEVTTTDSNQIHSFGVNRDTVYFIDDNQYMSYEETKGNGGGYIDSESFRLYSKDNPVYVTHYASRDPAEWSFNPEASLSRTIIPFSPDSSKIENVQVTNSDGHYVCTFDYTPFDEEKTYTDCTLEIDPETSLVLKYGYHVLSEGGKEVTSSDGKVHKTSPQDDIYTSEIVYGIDELPDYSQFEQYLNR